MAELTETEVISGTLRRVKLGEIEFRVPASPTIKYLFWMRRFLTQLGEGNLTDDDVVDCYEQTIMFLRRYNKTVDEDALQETCELSDLIGFYNRCFGVPSDETDADEARPTRRATRGPRNGKTPATSRSRS
jgi:hypothetical protein